MRRLIHISDLHFGRVRPGIVPALLEDIEAFEPHLVVVTGDLTQRARRAQFECAREFLRDLGRPYLVVPGNHDIAPVYRPFARVFAPYTGYRRYVSNDLNTEFSDDELLVLGLNTVEPLRWKEGTVSRAQLRWIEARVREHPMRFVVVASHHPLAETVTAGPMSKVRRHTELLETLESANVALCLTGHLHRSQLEPFAAAPGRAHVTLVVRASTATSTRVRHHANAYNRILIRPPKLDIRVRAWTGDRFETDHIEHFRSRGGRWEEGVVELAGQPSSWRAAR
jgi:3',5'-cyclic AMP phosphodiesterase CpdA